MILAGKATKTAGDETRGNGKSDVYARLGAAASKRHSASAEVDASSTR